MAPIASIQVTNNYAVLQCIFAKRSGVMGRVKAKCWRLGEYLLLASSEETNRKVAVVLPLYTKVLYRCWYLSSCNHSLTVVLWLSKRCVRLFTTSLKILYTSSASSNLSLREAFVTRLIALTRQVSKQYSHELIKTFYWRTEQEQRQKHRYSYTTHLRLYSGLDWKITS